MPYIKQIATSPVIHSDRGCVGADDVLTLLVHLGYLGYDEGTSEVLVPNKEVFDEFEVSVNAIGWKPVADALRASHDLMEATWALDATRVASSIEIAHLENQHLAYNDENALSYNLSLAYYTARNY